MNLVRESFHLRTGGFQVLLHKTFLEQVQSARYRARPTHECAAGWRYCTCASVDTYH